jgi:hypothetical protein
VKTNKILGLEGVLLHVECRRKSKLKIRTILFLFIIEAGLVIKKTKGTVLPNGASQDMHSYDPLKAGKINLDNTFFTFLLNNSNNLPIINFTKFIPSWQMVRDKSFAIFQA